MVGWWRNFYSSNRESEEEQQRQYSTSSHDAEELHGLGDEGSATVDLYSLLGVGVMASDEELRRSWKKKAFEHHPDRHAGDPNSTIRFQAIQHAYNVLKDKNKRNEYDKALLHRFYAEEYLYRCADLILTSSGLQLPIHFSKSADQSGSYGTEKIGSDSQFFLTATSMHPAASRTTTNTTASSF
ncbi:hypothetical protein M9435_005301 [Picochlorum sp. BPE23]|nr:hypothetical protein M9435_005301 [Picochlorum sp. BPE23]